MTSIMKQWPQRAEPRPDRGWQRDQSALCDITKG